MTGYLLLSDGTKIQGRILGTRKSRMGEIVFHTGMTGYQEIVTDPSYYDQIVLLTYPMIGNYGVCKQRNQSSGVKAKALIVKELYHSDDENHQSFLRYLEDEDVTVIEGLDTRHLTQIIREKGNLMCQIVVDDEILDFDDHAPAQSVYEVTSKFSYEIASGKIKVAVMDFGIKKGMLDALTDLGFTLKVFPADTTSQEIIDFEPNGLFLSNGPGDPETLTAIISEIKILSGLYPTFGICLGHQLLAHAYGAKTKKLLYGHRGGNHPVKNLALDRVYITAQNHGYVVESSSLDQSFLEVTHLHVNDNSIEGLKHKNKAIFSVQYHPEASPGPDDASYLFQEFKMMIEKNMEVSYV